MLINISTVGIVSRNKSYILTEYPPFWSIGLLPMILYKALNMQVSRKYIEKQKIFSYFGGKVL